MPARTTPSKEQPDATCAEDAIAAWSALQAAPAPVGLYEPFTRFGDLVMLSAISSARDGALVTGKVGRELDLEAGREAARRAADNLLAVLVDAAGGDPAGIERLLVVRGMSTPPRISLRSTR
jgi:enamine deaminase RidA (YjgF/YER057c/UK114 family)